MTTKDLPAGFDDEHSPFYVPEKARPFFLADRASMEGVYDLDALAEVEANYEFSVDHTVTGDAQQSPAPVREPGREALIARALHRRAVQLATSRPQP